MELLNALLDLVDATFLAIGWVGFWYTWVAAPGGNTLPPPGRPSDPDELQQFLLAASLKTPSRDRLA